jgi:hypothetical protein
LRDCESCTTGKQRCRCYHLQKVAHRECSVTTTVMFLPSKDKRNPDKQCSSVSPPSPFRARHQRLNHPARAADHAHCGPGRQRPPRIRRRRAASLTTVVSHTQAKSCAYTLASSTLCTYTVVTPICERHLQGLCVLHRKASAVPRAGGKIGARLICGVRSDG